MNILIGIFINFNYCRINVFMGFNMMVLIRVPVKSIIKNNTLNWKPMLFKTLLSN